MRPILLLGPAEPGGPPMERWLVEFRPMTLDEATGGVSEYSSVIVINDGGTETIARMAAALRLRQQQPLQFVGVLSYLDEAAIDKVMHGGAPDPALRIRLQKEVLTLEYQEV